VKLQFEFTQIAHVEFGVGKEDPKGQRFVNVAVDRGVQEALEEMARETWREMQSHSKTPPRYDPSEKHAALEHLYLPLADELSVAMRRLHEAENLALDGTALQTCDDVFCYFARLTDGPGSRLTAVRRAAQFKGTVRSRFVRLVTDALKLVREQVFRLDQDFDLLIDERNIHILRPSSFEFAGKLQDAILKAVPGNVALVQKELPFIEFANIEKYAIKHPRAARYLASICSQNQSRGVDRQALKALCERTDVQFAEKKGKLLIADDHVLGFLEVLDRRRYELELVRGSPERFRAASRQKIA
jgi:Kiwa protein KwaB-like